MVTLSVTGNISGEATARFGNIFDEAIRARRHPGGAALPFVIREV
jgi:hypothetical protein